MDKFFGVSRAEITSTTFSHEILPDKNAKTTTKAVKSAKNDKLFSGFSLLRYGLCAALLLVCLIGSFSGIAGTDKASDFIKGELNRDIVRELSGD